jgi:hypothetical protein
MSRVSHTFGRWSTSFLIIYVLFSNNDFPHFLCSSATLGASQAKEQDEERSTACLDKPWIERIHLRPMQEKGARVF